MTDRPADQPRVARCPSCGSEGEPRVWANECNGYVDPKALMKCADAWHDPARQITCEHQHLKWADGEGLEQQCKDCGLMSDQPRVAREFIAEIEKKYGHCCGDVLNIHADDLAGELASFASTVYEAAAEAGYEQGSRESAAPRVAAPALREQVEAFVKLHYDGYTFYAASGDREPMGRFDLAESILIFLKVARVAAVLPDTPRPSLDNVREQIGRIMHESWSKTKRAQGFHLTGECHDPCNGCHFCHADLIPWERLPEKQKDINRHAFDAVLGSGILVPAAAPSGLPEPPPVDARKLRKKPVEVTAYQVTNELLAAIILDGAPYPKGLTCTRASWHPERREVNYWQGSVITIHGQETTVEIGDWIITEPDGKHFYPCKPDIFEATYEAADHVAGVGKMIPADVLKGLIEKVLALIHR